MDLLARLPRGPRVQHVTPAEALDLVRGGARFLDVRTRDEYRAGHAEGAENVVLGELPDRLDDLDPDKPVVCICRSGRRSTDAGRILARHGLRAVHNVAGGSIAWREARLPWTE